MRQGAKKEVLVEVSHFSPSSDNIFFVLLNLVTVYPAKTPGLIWALPDLTHKQADSHLSCGTVMSMLRYNCLQSLKKIIAGRNSGLPLVFKGWVVFVCCTFYMHVLYQY